jgi:hypothetical protein
LARRFHYSGPERGRLKEINLDTDPENSQLSREPRRSVADPSTFPFERQNPYAKFTAEGRIPLSIELNLLDGEWSYAA